MHRIRGIRRGRLLAALLIVVVAGCASAPPVQEMSDARQAVEAAKAVDAPTKAPGAYIKAAAHMHYAESALQNGNYKIAREHATWAKTHALDARERALTRRPRQGEARPAAK